MKLRDFVSVTKNKANSQISFSLKARSLKGMGLTPENILDMKVPLKMNQKEVKWKTKDNKY